MSTMKRATRGWNVKAFIERIRLLFFFPSFGNTSTIDVCVRCLAMEDGGTEYI